MHMAAREFEDRSQTFFQALKSHDEEGDPNRLKCLKYLVMASMLHASTINPKMVQGLQGWIFLEEMKLCKMLQTCWKRQQVSCYGSTLFFRRRTKYKWLCWCEVSGTSTCEFIDAAGLYPIVGVVGFVLFIMAEARSRFFARSFQFFTISFSWFFRFQSRHFFLEFSPKFLLFLSVLSVWFVLCCIFCSSVKGIGVQLRVLLAFFMRWMTYSPRASVDKSIIEFWIKQFMYSFTFWNFVSIDYRSIMLYFITGCPRGRPLGHTCSDCWGVTILDI
jgi:hypothetical protein